jgi:hypothetical protein
VGSRIEILEAKASAAPKPHPSEDDS